MTKIKPPGTRKAARRTAQGGHTYHDSTIITLCGRLVAIDSDIVDLITLMNGIDGVETTGCCQGGPDFEDPCDLGHVAFRGAKASGFALAMAAKSFAPLGPSGMANKDSEYHFSIETGGESCCMRWTSATYPFVLAAAKEVVAEPVKVRKLYTTNEYIDGPRGRFHRRRR